jgi:hypothetical protein
VAVSCCFELRKQVRLEGREDAEFAIYGRGVVDVELGTEVAEDGEGEGIAATCVVKREVSGARGESGPRRHECMSGSVAH